MIHSIKNIIFDKEFILLSISSDKFSDEKIKVFFIINSKYSSSINPEIYEVPITFNIIFSNLFKLSILWKLSLVFSFLYFVIKIHIFLLNKIKN